MHVHVLVRDATSYRPDVLGENGANAVLRSTTSAREMLLAGFTTVRDMAQCTTHRICSGLDGARIRRRLDSMRRALLLPDTRSASLADTSIPRCMQGSTSLLHLGPEVGIADGADEVLKAVRHQLNAARASSRFCHRGSHVARGIGGVQQMTEAEMRVAVEEAARHGIKVAAHAHGTEGSLPPSGPASVDRARVDDRR